MIEAMRRTGATEVRIDEVGLGGGVVDRLREQGIEVTGLNASSAPGDPTRFANARAEWYWQLRERFEAGEIDLDPADEELAAQLCSLRFRVNSRGRKQIESKEDLRARGIASPDRADALMLCFAAPILRQTYVIVQEQERVRISPF